MGTLHEDQRTFLSVYRSVLLRMWNVSEKNPRENKSYIFMLVTVFSLRKSRRLWDSAEKYCRAGQATVDNMAHARCMLDD